MSDARETPGITPKYRIGETVRYRDRQDRLQMGSIHYIEAKWPGWGEGPVEPYLIYSLSHPTYRNGTFYTGQDAILHIVQGGPK